MQVGEAGEWAGSVGIVFERAGMSWICSLHGLMECGENFVGFKRGDIKKPAPDLSRREGRDFEARNNAEIISTAFECIPEICICRFRSRNDGACGEYDLVADDV